MDSIYYEYYFNKNGRLFKITETSGLKYVHVEENPKLAEYYLNIPKGEEYEEHYGLYNTISMTKLDGFIDALGIITWRDSDGVEKTAQFSPWMSYNEIYQLTEIDLYEDKVNKIIDNDIKILRTDEMFGHNVVFHQEIREVGDGVVLGETSLTNILLKD